MQAAMAAYQLMSGTQIKMVCIAQDNGCPDLGQIVGCYCLD